MRAICQAEMVAAAISGLEPLMASPNEKGRDDVPAPLSFVWHFICRGGAAGGRIRLASQYLSRDAAADPLLRQVFCAPHGVRGNH
jgi:hypothetical protein